MNPQEQHEYDVAVQVGYEHFYEKIPVYKPQILDLLNAIKKKRPELIVVEGTRKTNIWPGDRSASYTVYRDLSLAYADNPAQIVGSVRYDGEVYSVTSRLIKNARFSPWSSYDYHTKKSKHMNNVIKEALKYLLPTQFKEVVEESHEKFNQHISNIRSKSLQGMRHALHRTVDDLRDVQVLQYLA